MKIKTKAQEEMLGFGLIILIVAIIILVFIVLTLKKSPINEIESYKIESFIQSSLKHTTRYQDNFGYLSLRELILNCYNSKNCYGLNQTLSEIMEKSWIIEDDLVKGYELGITSDKGVLMLLKKGNLTKNYKGALQDLGVNELKFELRIYR